MSVEAFKTWGKKRTSKGGPWIEPPRKDRDALAGIDPRLKQIAFDKLAILRELHLRLSRLGKFKTKTAAMKGFIKDFNSGVLRPERSASSIRHVSRSGLYVWRKLYANGGLAALVPKYRTKQSTGKAIFRPLSNPVELKFPGRPRRNGKREFVSRIKRRWKIAPLGCPICLSIFYSMPVPKKTKMPRRMNLLNHRISHTGKPNLDALNAFTVDCLTGTVFRDHSQIVEVHSEKFFAWWPETRILIKALPG